MLQMSWSGLFSPLIFSICRYRVPIRYLALTNIFLDNTAALGKNVPASKLFLNRFFLFSWNKLYTGSGSFLFCICYCNKLTTFLVLAGESVTLHCDSRPSCTASWSVCETEPTLGTSIKSMFFFLYSLCCYSLSISRAFSISSVACFTCSAVWDARNFVYRRKSWKGKCQSQIREPERPHSWNLPHDIDLFEEHL